MMKVLLVDDEPIMRIGLRTLIDWEENGFKLAGEAGNGEEALRIMEENPVDILVTDLLMPRMDGLSLIRRTRERWPEVRIVVISCLDGFDSVKEAMKLGADDYFLKPTMEPEDLLALLIQIRGDIEQKRLRGQEWVELHEQAEVSRVWQKISAWRGWLLGRPLQVGSWPSPDEGRQTGYTLVLISLDRHLTPPPPLQDELIRTFRGCFPEEEEAVLCIPFDMEEIVFLMESPASLHGENLFERDILLHRLKDRLERFREQTGHTASVYVAGQAGDPEQVRQEYARGREVLLQRFYTGGGKVFEAKDAMDFFEDEGLWWTPGDREKLREAVHTEDQEAAREIVSRWADWITAMKPKPNRVYEAIHGLFNMMIGYAAAAGDSAGLWMNEYVSYAKIEAFAAWEELREWLMEAVDDFFEQHLTSFSAGGESANPFISKAVRYMHRHYAENISLQDIADHVKLSKSYFSDLFSRETGETVSEVLLRLRMEKAKRLLEVQTHKTYEVAEKVGFSDAKHFSRVFKRYTGLSPREYREGQRFDGFHPNDIHQIE